MSSARTSVNWCWLLCIPLAGCARTGVWLDEPNELSAAGVGGINNASGASGNAGSANAAGASGIAGTSGTMGTSGASGTPGVSGATGSAGAAQAGAGATAGAGGGTLPACAVPLAPMLSVIDAAEVLHFTVPGDLPIETAIAPADSAPADALFSALSDVPLSAFRGATRVQARVNDPSCVTSATFDAVYDVRDTCAPAEHAPTSTAVPKADPLISGWATGIQEYRVGPGVTQLLFTDPNAALGPAQGTSTGVVSLGDGGQISLSFATPIENGASWDFAVFENAFNDSYLELGFVEVSSDGSHFLRFDSAFLGQGPPAMSYAGDARKICGIAGNYAVGFGTPFDLDALKNQPLARSKVVNLDAIRFVRVVDILGDGNTLDSFGRPIFDPNPSAPTAGFDLDAIAVLHAGG